MAKSPRESFEKARGLVRVRRDRHGHFRVNHNAPGQLNIVLRINRGQGDGAEQIKPHAQTFRCQQRVRRHPEHALSVHTDPYAVPGEEKMLEHETNLVEKRAPNER